MLADLRDAVGAGDGFDKYGVQGNKGLSQHLDRDVLYRKGGFDVMP